MPRVWFHLIVTTYGSWLPGDPRGFRTWHHKEHVDGDYKSPPPTGFYDDRHGFSQRKLNDDPTVLSAPHREIVGLGLRDRLQQLGGRVLALSVSGCHCHLQVELEDCDVRLPLGVAKQHAWYALRAVAWKQKLWAKRCKVVRIRDRQHQRRVYRYVLKHREEGAWVWSELEQQCGNEGTEGT